MIKTNYSCLVYVYLQMEVPSPNRMQWLTIRGFIKIVVDSNGIVFGGAVRDWILHDYHAQSFYRYCQSINLPHKEVNSKYIDIKFHPESKDRIVLPRDVDIVIRERDLNFLQENCDKQNLQFKRIQQKALSDRYLSDKTGIALEDVSQYKYRVNSLKENYMQDILHNFPTPIFHEMYQYFIGAIKSIIFPKFEVDVIVIKGEYDDISIAPFGRLDFDVNSLIWSKNGLFMSPLYLKKHNPLANQIEIDKIMTNIYNKRATCIDRYFYSDFDERRFKYRVEKMLQKGWQFDMSNLFSNIEIIKNELYTGECIACRTSGSDFGRCSYKFTCCDARYHSIDCILSIMTKHVKLKNECPSCRESYTHNFDVRRIQSDIDLLSMMRDYPTQTCATPSIEFKPNILKRSVSL